MYTRVSRRGSTSFVLGIEVVPPTGYSKSIPQCHLRSTYSIEWRPCIHIGGIRVRAANSEQDRVQVLSLIVYRVDNTT